MWRKEANQAIEGDFKKMVAWKSQLIDNILAPILDAFWAAPGTDDFYTAGLV